MEKEVISFDLDGTIVKPDYNELIWFKEIPELYAEKYGVKLSKARQLVAKEYERVGEDDLRWYILEYWLKHFGFKIREREVLEKYADKVEVYEEVICALDEVHKRYTLVIASAMPRSFIDIKLKKENLFRYFKRIFSAVSDFKMVKKQAAFYENMCKRLKIPPQNLIHIGDNYEADYLVPRRVGIRAFYLDRTNSYSLTNVCVVRDLMEFVQRLRSKTNSPA